MKKKENGAWKKIKAAAAILCLIASAVTFVLGGVRLAAAAKDYTFFKTDTFYLVPEEDADHEDETVVLVEFATSDGAYTMNAKVDFDAYTAMSDETQLEGYIYVSDDGDYLAFANEPTAKEIRKADRDKNADVYSMLFGAGMAAALVAVSEIMAKL